MMTTTGDLLKLGKRHVPDFIGVFPIDKIPPTGQTGSFIVNTDTHNLPGQHWIAIRVTPSDVHVFDPMGAHCYPRLLWRFLDSTPQQTVHFNDVAVQDVNTNTCGQHCIAWLKSINTDS